MDALSHQDHTGQMRTAPGNMQAYSGATEQQHTDLNTANMSNIAAGQQTDIPGAFHVDSDDEDDDVAEVMHMLDCAPHDDDHDGDNAHNGQEMPLVDHHAQVARGHEGNEAYGGDDMEMDANSDMDLDHDAAQYHHDLHDNHEQQQQQEEEGEDMVDPFEAVSSFRAGLEERGQSLFLTPGIDEDLVEEAHAMDLPLTPFADVHTDTNCIIILPSLPHIDPSDPNPDPAVLATFEHVRTLREEAVRVVQRRGAGLVLGEEWLATCMRYDLLFNENGTAIFGPDGIVWELQNIFYPVA